MAKYFLEIDKGDMLLLMKDLDKLGDDFKTKRKVIRRGLKKAGEPIAKGVKARAEYAINDISKMANSFSWNTRVKNGVVYVWFQSMMKKGGYLTKIFEDGTVERFTKNRYWTGAIVEGGRNKVVNTKFIQKGFDAGKSATESKILYFVSKAIDKVVAKSRKLNKR